MNNLVIVAHADDEILNMGGTLHQWKDEYWRIVCVTRDIEHGRDSQFLDVCEALGAGGSILDYEMGLKTKWDNRSVAKDLDKVLAERNWDRIFTHNSVGEYGNAQHKQLHRIVRAKSLPNLFVFGHGFGDINFHVWLGKVDRVFKVNAAKMYTKKTKAIMAYSVFDVSSERFWRYD